MFDSLRTRFVLSHALPILILLPLLSFVLLFLAAWLALRARGERKRAGLPQGEVVYADTGRWSAVSKPYFSARHRLTGKPDYLVDSPEGLIPVEVKRTAAPPGGRAYASHVMQLAAYCLLVEDAQGRPPPYGLIRYGDATVRVDFTPLLRDELLATLAEMRERRGGRTVDRSHVEPARCRGCGVRHACSKQALD